MIIISEHGAKRLRERNGLKKKAMERHVALAFEKGTPREYTAGSLRHWLDAKTFGRGGRTEVLVYGDKAYVYADTHITKVLVTVLNIPSAIKAKNLKKMVRPVSA